jgi:thiamine-phosphate pyrophosphorylase
VVGIPSLIYSERGGSRNQPFINLRFMCDEAAPAMQDNNSTALRILDANFNRCCEGLRVVEEYLRFGLEDPHLSSVCKEIRHAVTQAIAPVGIEPLHAARDAAGDVGATIGTDSEYARETPRGVATASLKRVEQALRAMEEYAKLVSASIAGHLEPLRYRVYTLEQAMTTSSRNLQRLEDACLYVLLDGRPSVEAFRNLATELVQGGADGIQLRDKNLTDRELVERARCLRSVTRDSGTWMIVNDRPDIALLAHADGVHVGQDEISVKDARTLLGPNALVGVSTHDLQQAHQAVLAGADYLGCGPTFPSTTKSFQHFAGLEFLREVHDQIRLPAFAIGGIDHDNLAQVAATGFRRVAVQHAVIGAANPKNALQQMRKTLLSSDACAQDVPSSRSK